MSSSAYTSEQISQYLNYIQLPQSYQSQPTTNQPTRPLDLAYLTALHVHQISTIPYENLTLHYSHHKQVNLDPQALFDKFLVQRRGGYCLETSLFFNHVLRALGFQVYTAPVRIRLRKNTVPFGDFAGLRHIVNIVTLPDPQSPTSTIKYMVDVGFGGDGATKPLALIHNIPQHNLGTQSIRLIHDTIPEQIEQSETHKLWQYQYRNGPDQDWNTYYAFAEFEMLPIEWDTLNFWLTNHPDSFQRWIVLAIKFIRSSSSSSSSNKIKENNKINNIESSDNEEENHNDEIPKITGKVMLADTKLKRNLGGRTELVAEFQSEQQRVDALREWFGLELSEDEVNAIKGHTTAIDETVFVEQVNGNESRKNEESSDNVSLGKDRVIIANAA